MINQYNNGITNLKINIQEKNIKSLTEIIILILKEKIIFQPLN